MAADRERLLEGIEHARAGRWDEAHAVAQSLEGDPRADWLHAILHKIEGDASNGRYWYSRSPTHMRASPTVPRNSTLLRARSRRAIKHGVWPSAGKTCTHRPLSSRRP